MSPQRPSLPLSQFFFFSLGHVLNDVTAAIFFTYLLIFLMNVKGFSPAMAGNLLLAGQLADGISTPFFGFESDKADKLFPPCGRYGRRKSWHLGGILTVLVTIPFVFGGCPGGCADADEGAMAAFYVPLICISQLGWAATQVSHMALIPELTPLERERVVLNSVRYAAQVVANIVAYAVFFLLLGVDSGSASVSPADASKFQFLALICCGFGFVCAIGFQCGVREPKRGANCSNNSSSSNKDSRSNNKDNGSRNNNNEDSSNNNNNNRNNTTSLYQNNNVLDSISSAPQSLRVQSTLDHAPSHSTSFTWHDWLREPRFYIVTLIYMSSQVIFNVGQTYVPLYLTQSLGLGKFYIAVIPIVVFTSGFFASMVVRLLTSAMGVHVTSLLGSAVVIAGCGWMFDMGLGLYIFGASVLLGAGQSVLIIVAMAFISEMIGDRTSTAGFVYSFISCMDKFSGGAVIVIIQHLQPVEESIMSNAPPTPDGPKTMPFFRDVMTFVCGGIAAFSSVLVLILWIIKRIETKTKEQRKQISRLTLTNWDISTSGVQEESIRAEKPPGGSVDHRLDTKSPDDVAGREIDSSLRNQVLEDKNITLSIERNSPNLTSGSINEFATPEATDDRPLDSSSISRSSFLSSLKSSYKSALTSSLMASIELSAGLDPRSAPTLARAAMQAKSNNAVHASGGTIGNQVD